MYSIPINQFNKVELNSTKGENEMQSTYTSQIPGFYKYPISKRLQVIGEAAGLTPEEFALLQQFGSLSEDQADRMIENVIGVMPIPLGVAANFMVNGREIFVPMATEEPSVVAAASNMAKAARAKGGFWTSHTGSVMIGQIQVLNVTDPYNAVARLYEIKQEILDLCNTKDPTLVSFGGGAKNIEVRVVDTASGSMVVVHLLVDTKDAMGANTVNTMAEAVAPLIEKVTGGRVLLRIISNLADQRIVRARTIIDKDSIGGEEIVNNIVSAYEFADYDPYRAATHNKGIMNGISATVLATGNDTRAVEAGAHAYAAKDGRYRSLTKWEKDRDGNLVGTIEMPLAVGLVGGATKTHPIARISLKILNIKKAEELAGIIAAVGLAQNLGALRALATEGIQKGHMALHARNLAVMAGAKLDQVDDIVKQVVKEKDVRYDRILEIVNSLN